jgi:exodeoxyribonuclease VII large subunit
MMKIYSVTEVTLYLRRIIESDELLSSLQVKGEISNFKESHSGHCYFTLKDSAAQIACVLFRGSRSRIAFKIREGARVVARGRITIYEKQGQYQLIVDSMKEEGLGDLYERFILLKQKLEKEGLFDPRHKKKLPFFPGTVGVVTSPFGAAIRDIITTIRRRNNSVRIILSPVVVQGAEAPPSICRGLERIQAVGDVDVIILGRGGGSFEELMAFNDERVARAIHGCRVPVVSAVGHETDFTISDMVADFRAATPTAAAQNVVPDKRELLNGLESSRLRMMKGLMKQIRSSRSILEGMKSRAIFKYPERRIQDLQQDLDMLFARLGRAGRYYIAGKMGALEGLYHKLEARNARKILERGYCIALRHPEHKLISSVEDVKMNDEISLIVHDGDIDAVVKGRRDTDVLSREAG